MPSEIPPFADQWIKQWQEAAPRLQAIRDEELRRRGGNASRPLAGHRVYDRNPERHGMVVMQQWFLRKHLLSLMRKAQDS